MPTPIRRRRIYEDVALRIEEMIREGTYKPGDQLPSERSFMEEFQVGRSAVREAMTALQKMGLVLVSTGERARVTTPTPLALVNELSGAARLLLAQEGGVRRFQEARAVFEIGLARLAAQRATAEAVEPLRRALEANRQAIGDHPAFRRTDVAFHFEIAALSGNTIFTSLHAALAEWLTEQRETSGRSPGAAEAAYAAHERIYAAIAAKDFAEAEQAMEDHLAAVHARYWQMVGDGHAG